MERLRRPGGGRKSPLTRPCQRQRNNAAGSGGSHEGESGILIRRKSVGQIALIAVPMMIAACVVIAIALGRMRENAIADAQRANDTMASILSQQVFQSVQAIDLVLGDLVARAAVPEIVSDADLRREMGTKSTYEFLLDRLGHLPQADLISVFDSSGKFIVSSRCLAGPAGQCLGARSLRLSQATSGSLAVHRPERGLPRLRKPERLFQPPARESQWRFHRDGYRRRPPGILFAALRRHFSYSRRLRQTAAPGRHLSRDLSRAGQPQQAF